MIAVLQRVAHASVKIDGEAVGKCKKGLLILVGVADDDTVSDADILTEKISKLRIFEDRDGKMNLSVLDIGGEALVVSNFTLLADYRHGNRPSFFGAASPDSAKGLYEYFAGRLSDKSIHTETGVFGADMQIDLQNDGPVTLVLDSNVLLKKVGK